MHFTFRELKDVVSALSLNSRPDDSFIVLASRFHDDEVAYFESGKHFKDMWLGTGDYAELGRSISWDDDLSLFRVKYGEISSSWTFTDVDPATTSALPSDGHVIGLCSMRSGGSKTYSCLHAALREGTYIEYWINGDSIKQAALIDDYIFNKLKDWACQKT